jgi:16S rRNA U1498 N3-methylase RsmE
VLGAIVGDHVRAGVVGGRLGRAELLADDGAAITLRLALTEPASAALPIELVLAIPRPKVLSRVIEAAAAFGVARVALTNAWRVDKSYLRSPRLAPDALAAAARLGAEQGATTHLPTITIHHRLMALLDARWPDPASSDPASTAAAGHDAGSHDAAGQDPAAAHEPAAHDPALAHDAGGDEVRLIAHPGALPIEAAIHEVRLIAHPGAPPIETAVGRAAGPTVLAIGPEGGWIPREVETFIARGFTPVSLGAPILRVETAVAAALGQLLVLARLRAAAG